MQHSVLHRGCYQGVERWVLSCHGGYAEQASYRITGTLRPGVRRLGMMNLGARQRSLPAREEMGVWLS